MLGMKLIKMKFRFTILNPVWTFFSGASPIMLLLIASLILSCTNNSNPVQLTDSPLIEASAFTASSTLPENTIWVDCREFRYFLDGHIPFAVNINRNDISDTLGNVLPAVEIKSFLGKLGIPGNARLLLYDDNGGVEAARIWWVLYLYGFDKSSILNGGIQAWKTLDLPITNKETKRKPVTFEFPNHGVSSIISMLKEVDGAENILLLDTRSPEEFSGKIVKAGAVYGGHIPGAINIDYTELLFEDQYGAYRIKPIHELESLLSEYGIKKEDRIVTYCHSGVRSSLFLFVLYKLLNFPTVSNYDGSWVEYSRKHPQEEKLQ
jgi:thiosulfate/3-mercaptopyruvate sulfurtransferase